MKKFVRSFVAFLVLLLIIIPIIELGIEILPSNIKYKKDWMLKNSKRVEILILGHSHAFQGINPLEFDNYAFNLADHGQGLAIDKFLTDKYITVCPNLKFIIIPLSYQSLTTPAVYGVSKTQEMSYYVYMGYKDRPICSRLSYEIFYPDFTKYKIESLLIKQKSVFCTSRGQDSLSILNKRKGDWDDGEKTANDYTGTADWKLIRQNVEFLNSIASKCKERNIKLILVTFPATSSYYNNLNSKQLGLMHDTAIKTMNKYNNVTYYDFMEDKRFSEKDFMDGTHLTTDYGALKLTRILNDTLLSIH